MKLANSLIEQAQKLERLATYPRCTFCHRLDADSTLVETGEKLVAICTFCAENV